MAPSSYEQEKEPISSKLEPVALTLAFLLCTLLYLPSITEEYGYLDDYAFLDFTDDSFQGTESPFNSYLTWMGRPLMGATLYYCCDIAGTVSGLAIIRIAALAGFFLLFYVISRLALKACLTGIFRIGFIIAMALTPSAAIAIGWVSAGLPHLGGLLAATFAGYCAWQAWHLEEPAKDIKIRVLWGIGAFFFGLTACLFYQPTVSLAYTVLFILFSASWKNGWSNAWRFIGGYVTIGISMLVYLLLARKLMYSFLEQSEEASNFQYKVVIADFSFMLDRVKDLFRTVIPDTLAFWENFQYPNGNYMLSYLAAFIILCTLVAFVFKHPRKDKILTVSLYLMSFIATLWACSYFYIIPRDGFIGFGVYRIWHGLVILCLFCLFAGIQYQWKVLNEISPPSRWLVLGFPIALCWYMISGFTGYFKPLFVDLCAGEWAFIQDGVNSQKEAIRESGKVVIEPHLVSGFVYEGARNLAEYGNYYMSGNIASVLNNALREAGLGTVGSGEGKITVYYQRSKDPTAPLIDVWQIQLKEPIESGEDNFWGHYTRYPYGFIESEYWGRLRELEYPKHEHALYGVIEVDKVENGTVYFRKPDFGYCSYEIGNPNLFVNYDEGVVYYIETPKLVTNMQTLEPHHFLW